MGIGNEAKVFVVAEMRKPMDTGALVNAAASNPALGHSFMQHPYWRSRSTHPAERAYMQDRGNVLA